MQDNLLKMNIPRFTPRDAQVLAMWCTRHADLFPSVCVWLESVVDAECRRQPHEEPGMISLPEQLTEPELLSGELFSEFLQGVHFLSRAPLSPGSAAFVDELDHLLVVLAGAHIKAGVTA